MKKKHGVDDHNYQDGLGEHTKCLNLHFFSKEVVWLCLSVK